MFYCQYHFSLLLVPHTDAEVAIITAHQPTTLFNEARCVDVGDFKLFLFVLAISDGELVLEGVNKESSFLEAVGE